MIAVLFEALPHPHRKNDYLNAASSLAPHLQEVDGFISIERFESLAQPGKVLSLSFWRDEDAVKQWRTFEATAPFRKPGGRPSLPSIGCALRRLFAIME